MGRLREDGDPLDASDDFKIQANGLDLAFLAAQALGVQREEICAFLVHSDLLPQDFSGAVHAATVQELRRVIHGIAQRAELSDALLFIAVNHGVPEGLLTVDPTPELDEDLTPALLTPDVLRDCLRPFQGPQILVIAACYAGRFLALGHAERAVFAACAPDETYLIPREGCAWSTFLDELFGAWCAVALSDAIPKDRLSLDAAFERAHERLVAARAPNLPHRTGAAAWPP